MFITNMKLRLRRDENKKIALRLWLMIFLTAFVLTGCVSAQEASNQNRPTTESMSNQDLSTDEGVLAELQKITDARRENLGLINKPASKLEVKNVCIERFKETSKIIVIGFFAYDVGCRFDGAFIGSRYFEKTEIEMHKNALHALGWEKAPKREREMLAKFWVEKGLLAFFTVLYTKDKDLNNQGFHPPQAVSDENGEIKVTLWIQIPPGMRREEGFQHVEYRFAKDGSFSGNSTLANLLIDR
jgi:hypothetical protein